MQTENLTINEAIAFLHQLNARISELSSLRSQVCTTQTRYHGDESRVETTVQYDVKAVDKKVTELQNWKFRIESKIKAVNAKTQIGLDIPIEELLAPLS